MPGTSSVLSEFFARHPSSIGASGVGGHYRVICEGCGVILSVAIPDPAPPALDIRCEQCGWSEHFGPPAPLPATDEPARPASDQQQSFAW